MTTTINPIAKYTLSTDTTIIQEQTEEECRPYFVDIPSLPKNQIHHLREIGLLPRSLNDAVVEEEEGGMECVLEEDKDAYTSPVILSDSLEEAYRKDSNDNENEDFDVLLLREKHTKYCLRGLINPLHSNFACLDASHSWMIYWLLQSLDILDALPSGDVLMTIVRKLEGCWNEDTGGFGGGCAQLSHCAPTYAAISSLAIIGTCEKEEAAEYAIRLVKRYRPKLKQWFRTLYEDSSGGYRMQHDGEVDVRAYYCIVAVSSLLHIMQEELFRHTRYIARCQTYEGGFGGEPGNEAHGGYTYCALAALGLLNQLESVDVRGCRGWIARRQMGYEGGFSGRANKLVDGCYSFWQGASMAILDMPHPTPLDTHRNTAVEEGTLLFHQAALQKYILLCAQNMSEGGLRDKPSKGTDFYHTCYNLSGLSVSQNSKEVVYGHERNGVRLTHPFFNIARDRVEKIKRLFYTEEERTHLLF